MRRPQQHYGNQSGNILFLILLAVVLFAALSYAITQSTRGGGNSANTEKLQSTAAELINYATLVEQTVSRLRMSGGCTDTQISFLYDSDADGTVETNGQDLYYNPNAPGDKHCNVFDAAGGGLYVKEKLPDIYLQTSGWVVNGTTTGWYNTYGGRPMFQAGNATSTTAQDLIFVVPFVSKELCAAMNTALNGVTTVNLNNYYWYVWNFNGSYNNPTTQDVSLPWNNGCVYKAGDNYYEFYQVLIAR